MSDSATLVISTDPERLHEVRVWVEKTLAAWDADSYVGRLAVTELVGNVQRHVGDAQATVRIYPCDRGVCLEVADSSPVAPVVRDPGLLAESGRGLAVLREMTKALGWNPTATGKVVFVVLEAGRA